MLLSAEIRWFWEGANASLQQWFAEMSLKPGGGTRRSDVYLFDPSQTELGIKSRGSKPGIEIKTLVSQRDQLVLGPLMATTQLWTKVSSKPLSLAGMPCLATNKTRWLRKYDTGGVDVREIELGVDEQPSSGESLPANGCNVELTHVWLDNSSQPWVTLGFEAFGSFERVEASIAATVRILASKPLPDIEPGIESSYPQWLATRGLA